MLGACNEAAPTNRPFDYNEVAGQLDVELTKI